MLFLRAARRILGLYGSSYLDQPLLIGHYSEPGFPITVLTGHRLQACALDADDSAGNYRDNNKCSEEKQSPCLVLLRRFL